MKTRSVIAFVAVGLLAGLSACSSTPDDDQPIPTTRPPVYQTPVPSNPSGQPAQPEPSASQARPVANDQCGAEQLQYLVGKPRTDIPVPLNPGKRRVVCSTCVITMDYAADRQTIVFDTDSGLIQSVKCG